MATNVMPAQDGPRLRANCLNFWEVWAQAIALISPTMTAALIVPVMFGSAGEESWLAYLFGTVMLLFVAFNLNHFARRSTSAGSMYAYTSRGLGPTAGGIAGWCLIWAYLFIGIAGLTGFTNFASILLGLMHVHVPLTLLFAACALAAWYISIKDIQVSTILMLVLEGVSVALILALTFIVLFKHGAPVDHAQLTLSGTKPFSLGLGVVIAIFSLVGFECATAFGEETKNPLKTIPRAVIWSLLATGIFFILVSYMEVYGVRGYKMTLDQLTAPLNTLADLNGVGWLKAPISLGAMASFFSLALSCMNAGARILYPMGRHGVFHASVGRSHDKYQTPHVAVTVMAVLMFAIVATIYGFHGSVLDVFSWAGTFGAFGFLFSYFFITVAAPFYLKKEGTLTAGNIALSVVTLILLLVPAVGSVYPVPPAPINYFPYIFLAYFLTGAAWFLTLRMRSPQTVIEIERDIEETHARFTAPSEEAMAVS
ncbi:amino acid permease [Capsulimonas corticalis]|uniref:Amino acid permease n=1 Tax=Capsulimonas corticalis TaxID=2219043 RepID=A0A402CVI8_9BACT|nr:APC family permease [Capsulimonas corticalis]BDI30410.1 amino acid permease [Capsulimonas corticalis]